MENKELIKRVTHRLKALVGNNKFHRSYNASRFAGAIEALLIQEGVLGPDEQFKYETGGKKYFPLIGDFRWTESHPHHILKLAEAYLQQFVPAQLEAEAIRCAYRKGWVLTGHKSEECYWWNHARNERRPIDWDKPLIEQIPYEGTEA